MKLIDASETVVIVVGSDARVEERDGPTARRLKEEIDQRSDGQSFRRAVIVTDAWYVEHEVLHPNPTIVLGGPGVNRMAGAWSQGTSLLWSRDRRAFLQADYDSEPKRALLWGGDAEATMVAVQAFVSQGFLDDLLRRIWRFRTEVYV